MVIAKIGTLKRILAKYPDDADIMVSIINNKTYLVVTWNTSRIGFIQQTIPISDDPSITETIDPEDDLDP